MDKHRTVLGALFLLIAGKRAAPLRAYSPQTVVEETR